MHKILVIRLYLPLDALHVSDYIRKNFYKLYIAYTKCDVQLIKLLVVMN